MAPSQAQLDHARKTTYTAVWDTADKYLRSVVEPKEYSDYISQIVVLRRLECILADSKAEVLKFISDNTKGATVEVAPAIMDLRIRTSFSLHFYETIVTVMQEDQSTEEFFLMNHGAMRELNTMLAQIVYAAAHETN